MKRLPEWEQSTPRAELICLIMAAQGDLLNIANNDVPIIRIGSVAERAEKFLADAQQILRDMPEGEW